MASRVQEALEFVGMSEFMIESQLDYLEVKNNVGYRRYCSYETINFGFWMRQSSMLDPEGRQELIQSIKAIRKEYGMTVLSITHDLDGGRFE